MFNVPDHLLDLVPRGPVRPIEILVVAGKDGVGAARDNRGQQSVINKVIRRVVIRNAATPAPAVVQTFAGVADPGGGQDLH